MGKAGKLKGSSAQLTHSCLVKAATRATSGDGRCHRASRASDAQVLSQEGRDHAQPNDRDRAMVLLQHGDGVTTSSH
jgi:hypothetical protein